MLEGEAGVFEGMLGKFGCLGEFKVGMFNGEVGTFEGKAWMFEEAETFQLWEVVWMFDGEVGMFNIR